jgi:ABC-type glycerol-3-phosphate transport system substrate-binding protein
LAILSRILISILIAGAAAVLIWGPRPEQPIPPGREHDVIIQYWEKWTGEESRAMQQIVDDFNNSVGRDKHIYVQYMSMSNITQKTLAATAAGVPPDVAGLWHDVLVQLAALGALEPLDDLAASHGITADYYKPVYWDSCHYDGHLYALISTPGDVALFYNKKIFHDESAKLIAAGLDPNRPPKTLQELDRYAAALDKFAPGPDGKPQLVRAGYLPLEPGWYIAETQLWFGTDFWDPVNQRFIVDDPRILAAGKWMQGYVNRLGVDQINRFGGTVKNFDSPQNPFLAGTVAMEQQGPFLATYIHTWNPSMDGQWGAAPFPSAVPGLDNVTFCAFDALMIPRGCKHKNEAFEFIAFVNRQDEMEKLCSLHCKNSPLEKVSENFITHHKNPFIQVFEDLARSPNAHGPIQCPIAKQGGDEIQAMYQGIARGSRDPVTTVVDVQHLLDAKWADYQHEQELRHVALVR